ncbi:MAG: hypothetical protein ACM3IG_06315 [Myxococcales bacterium]
MVNDPPSVPPPPASGKLHYRLYFIRGSGHISKMHEFFAHDDEAAINTARAWKEGWDVELWCKERKVWSSKAGS